MEDGGVRLTDGRFLAYRSWGTADGPTVLAFHGCPGSRVWWPGEEHTRLAGVQLVTVDRPGYGRSDPLPGRPLLGWADDVAELAAHLDAERFGVVGWSGGAPFAAAVARALPDRLTGVCLVSSGSLTWALDEDPLDEEDREMVELIARVGRVDATLRLAADQEAWAEGVAQDPQPIVSEGVGDADLRTLREDPSVATGLADSFREAFRQGAVGMVTDWVAQVPPWGFSLRDIEVPINLWHGSQDTMVSTEQVHDLAAMIPRSYVTEWPDHGHLGITQHWPSVLVTCVGDKENQASGT